MRIKSRTLQVVFEHDVTVGNGAITATIEHMAFVHLTRERVVDVDLEFSDVKNIKLMGIAIEDGYKHYDKFVEGMKNLDIDVVKLFDDAAASLITDNDMSQLKQMYIDGVLRDRQTSFNFTGPR